VESLLLGILHLKQVELDELKQVKLAFAAEFVEDLNCTESLCHTCRLVLDHLEQLLDTVLGFFVIEHGTPQSES
jgi:hypothetical protein